MIELVVIVHANADNENMRMCEKMCINEYKKNWDTKLSYHGSSGKRLSLVDFNSRHLRKSEVKNYNANTLNNVWTNSIALR